MIAQSVRFGCLVLFAAVGGWAHAFPGSLDTNFGCAAPPCTGKVTAGVPTSTGVAQAFSMALQGDGKIVMAGSSGSGSGQNFGVARFNTNGTLDTTFNGTGTISTAFGAGDDHANSVAISPLDGKIVAAGATFQNFTWYFAATRYTTGGVVDSTFGTQITTVGSTYNEAFAVAVDGSGNVVLAGKAGESSATDFALVRYNSAGALDVSFGGSGKVRTAIPITCASGCVGQAQAIAIQSDGKIVVAGWSGPLSNSDFVLVRYNSNGTLDSTFGAGGIKVHAISPYNDAAYAVKIVTLPDSTQRIVVAGITNNSTNNKASFALARYTMTGSVDTAFGTNGVTITSMSGGNDIATSIAIAADGNIVVGGDENDLAGDFVVARYTANGVLDNTFGCSTSGTCSGRVFTDFSGGADQGKSIAIQSDGNIVLGGVATAGSTARFGLARYLGGGSVGTGPGATQLAITSVNGGAPVQAGIAFPVAIQSRDSSGAPANVTTATQVSLALTTGAGPLTGTVSCTIAAATNNCTASALTLTVAQTGAVLTATRSTGDTLAPANSAPFSVVAGAATNVIVSGYPGSSAAGSTNAFTVRARDTYGNTATGYRGTVAFGSSDPAALLPSPYAFVAGDGGEHAFGATFKTAGNWSLAATDTVTGSITGTQTGIGVTPGAPATIVMSSGSGQNTAVNSNFAFALVANVKDAYGNVVPGTPVNYIAPATGPGATFTGGGTTISVNTDAAGNSSSGVAKANLSAGTYSVTANITGLTPAAFAMTNNAAVATSTVALTAGTTPAAVDTSLTFTATVSGGAGIPTGTVNFIDGANTLCGAVILNAAGQAGCTTQSLIVGSHGIVAQYSGNASYNGINSTSLPQSITKTTPVATITSATPNPSAVNTPVVVHYTVVPSPSGPVAPGGNVTVGDGVVSCTGTVAAGQCSLTLTSTGTRTLTASYVGDSNFNAATSPGYAQTVSAALATVALSASPATVALGSTSTITANVTGSAGTPTGTVSVSGAGGICTITLAAATGSGSCFLPTNTVGASQTVTGSYNPAATYGTSSGTTSLTVTQATPNVSVSPSPVTINLGQATSVSTTVTGGAGTATGTVNVSIAGGGSCTVTLASGGGSCSLTPLSAGAGKTVTATYSGDGKYVSANGTSSVTVNKVTPTVTITATPSTIGVGGTSTVSATVSSPAGTPTGSVSVSGAGGTCTITLASGTGSCGLVGATVGAGQVTGTYGGDANFNGASGTAPLTVSSMIAAVTLVANPASVVVGATSTISATVSGGVGTPTGSVSVSGAGGSCSITLSSSNGTGVGSCVLTTSVVGASSTITGAYSGNATYNPTTGTVQLAVNKATPTVTLTPPTSSIALGQGTLMTATVSGGVGIPTGTVTLTGGGGSCGINLTSGSGSCTLTPTSAGAGETVTGSYGGDAKYAVNTGVATVNVSKATPAVTISATPSTITAGTATSIQATVASAAGVPSGSVSVSGAGGACTINLASGSGSCSLVGSTVGASQTITGTYGGDGNFNGSAGTASLTVNPGSVTPPVLDIDLNGSIDALTDGILVERYLFGLTGPSLINGAIGMNAQRNTATSIVAYLDSLGTSLDIDGDGRKDGLTDGLLVIRYLFGLRGSSLIQGAISPGATRNTAPLIEAYLFSLTQPH